MKFEAKKEFTDPLKEKFTYRGVLRSSNGVRHEFEVKSEKTWGELLDEIPSDEEKVEVTKADLKRAWLIRAGHLYSKGLEGPAFQEFCKELGFKDE